MVGTILVAGYVVLAADAPHYTLNGCGDCHITHNAAGAQLTDVNGNGNLCISCHTSGGTASAKPFLNANQALPWPGLPSSIMATGTSHRWDASAAGHITLQSGTGTGAIIPTGAYTGTYAKTYTITISTAGAVGTAQFGWTATSPGGGSGANIPTAANVALDQGVSLAFFNGTNGTSFQQNDQWYLYVRPDLRHPTNAVMLAHMSSNMVYCSTCHDQHSQTNTPFDASAPATPGTSGRHFMRVANTLNEICVDCHAVRNVTNSVAGSHPIKISIPADAYHTNPPSFLPLESTTNVTCLTCHDVHYNVTNDGMLIRTNITRLCVSCHTLADTNSTTAHFDVNDSNTLWPGGKWGSLMPVRTNSLALRGTCVNCHATHGWPDASNPTNHYPKLLADFEENLCYTCHGTNGPATKLVWSDFTDAYHHPVYNRDPKRWTGRSVECTDCHNVHKAKDGSHNYNTTATATRNTITNSPSLTGAAGVDFGYSTLSNYQGIALGLYTAIPESVGATNEYQVCFRCHTGYAYPSYTNGTASFTTNSATVTGSGTTWTSNLVGATMIRVGDTNAYRVTAITSGTGLTITPAFRYATASGQGYTISIPTAGFTPIYTNGTVTFTTNSATVTGSGTAWVAGMVGMWIARNNDTGAVYKITAWTSATSMTIYPAYTGATASAQAYAISGDTDLAQEFSPKNRSGHPIMTGLNNYPNSSAPKALLAAALKAPWNVNVGTQTMTCSDCHNTDNTTAGAAQGPHGSAYQFMLRTFSGGTSPVNWPTNTTFASSWCANCHIDNVSATVHTRSNHTNARCYGCHIVVPHGGKVSRLLNANRGGTLPARYAYNNSTNTVMLTGINKAAAGSYSESGSCGGVSSSCSHHSTGTGSESW